MRLYGAITKVDRDKRMVYGYASTEALDTQGEIVRKDALEAALPDYMKFGNIREMHQPSAIGVVKEAAVDDKGLRLAAKIVDREAWDKVKEGVYQGFSIGGQVTDRDPVESHVITGLTLTEISLVDRPANPEAVIELYKAAAPAPSSAAVIAKAARHLPPDLARRVAGCYALAGEVETARRALSVAKALGVKTAASADDIARAEAFIRETTEMVRRQAEQYLTVPMRELEPIITGQDGTLAMQAIRSCFGASAARPLAQSWGDPQ